MRVEIILSLESAHRVPGDSDVFLKTSFYLFRFLRDRSKRGTVVRLSGEHPTESVCLQELLKRLQDRHGECAQTVGKSEEATPNVFQPIHQMCCSR